jgi:HEAT repeat protein
MQDKNQRVLVTMATMALAAGAGLLLAGCTAEREPEEVGQARQVLEQGWAEPQVQLIMLPLFAQHPGSEAALEKLEAALADPRPAIRREAAHALALWRDPATRELLMPLLDDDSKSVKLMAARALGQLGVAEAEPVLEEMKIDQDGQLRPDVCAALAEIDPESCVPVALEIMGAKETDRHESAAAALAAVGGEPAREALREGLEKLRGEKRAPVIEALGEVGTEDDVDAVLKYIDFRENVIAVLEALGDLGGEKAVETLRRYLDVEDAGARAEAASALAQLGELDEPVVTALRETAASDQEGVRYILATRLQSGYGEAADEVLVELAGDESPLVRRAAVESMLADPSPALLPGARQAFEMGRDERQGQAYEAALQALLVLSRIPGEESQAILREALGSPNWAYSIQAALGLLDRRGGAGEAQG